MRKDVSMKIIFIALLSSLLLVSSCYKNHTDKNLEYSAKTESASNSIIIVDKGSDSDYLNDLVYHDYGSAIKLSIHSKITLPKLNLNLTNETANIYIINMESKEEFKLCNYQPEQNISYTFDTDGFYKIVAKISSGEIIDLTPKAMIETKNSIENSDGILPLE
jgi:hypothetical protein